MSDLTAGQFLMSALATAAKMPILGMRVRTAPPCSNVEVTHTETSAGTEPQFHPASPTLHSPLITVNPPGVQP